MCVFKLGVLNSIKMHKRKPMSKSVSTPPLQKTLPWKEKKTEAPSSTDGTRQKYDLKRHNREFDPWQHGYIWKQGCMWYRRPDGVDVRAYSNVNEFDEYGELIPIV